jgi:hypothetical protein
MNLVMIQHALMFFGLLAGVAIVVETYRAAKRLDSTKQTEIENQTNRANTAEANLKAANEKHEHEAERNQ